MADPNQFVILLDPWATLGSPPPHPEQLDVHLTLTRPGLGTRDVLDVLMLTSPVSAKVPATSRAANLHRRNCTRR